MATVDQGGKPALGRYETEEGLAIRLREYNRGIGMSWEQADEAGDAEARHQVMLVDCERASNFDELRAVVRRLITGD